MTCSGPCAAGYFCGQGSTTATASECGGESFYCPPGSSAPNPVSPGFFTTGGSGPTTRTAAQPCSLGHFCIGDGLSRPCAAGRFGGSPELQTSDCSGLCSAGYYCGPASNSSTQEPCGSVAVYCPSGTSDRLSVSAGYYSTPDTAPESLRVGQTICNPGHFCEGGVQQPCSAGRYGPGTGIATECSLLCREGYYCPAGSVTDAPNECGSVDKYCPTGSGVPLAVPPGRFSTGGTTRTRTATELCPATGVYCPGDGVISPCPAGRYGAGPGLSLANCTDGCTAGYFCPPQSVNGTAEPCGGPDVYCPAATSVRRLVPVGSYSTPLSSPADVRESFAECPPGSTCSGGVRSECPPGRYNDKFGHTTECPLCPPGYFCTGGTTSPSLTCDTPDVYCPVGSSAPLPVGDGNFSIATGSSLYFAQEVCPPGSHCAAGVKHACPGGRFGSLPSETRSLCEGPCAAGWYCPAGSVSPTQEPCGGTHLACPEATPERLTLAPGEYSVPTDAPAEHRVGILPCGPGHFCNNGNRSVCFPGFYGDGDRHFRYSCAVPPFRRIPFS